MMTATFMDRTQRSRCQATPKVQISALLATLERCDPDTWAHSLRVRQYALLLADSLNLDARSQRRLGLAAMLHDVGKLQIPQAILHKPGLLTLLERGVVENHPAHGEEMVVAIVRNRSVLQTIRGHHERFDGSGYPDGLKGQQFPLLARLLAIADCFDAMTSARSYKKAFSWSESMKLLRQGAGCQFDPELVPACIDALIRCDGHSAVSASVNQNRYFSRVASRYFFHGEARISSSGAPFEAGVEF